MMNKKKVLLISVVLVLIVLGVLAVVGGVQKLLKHEQNQDTRINNLAGQFRELDERLHRSTEYWKYIKPDWNGRINYFAIGNSLTTVGGNWNRGACSTQPDNDYFGLVVKALYFQNRQSKTFSEGSNDEESDEESDVVVAHRYNFNVWERSPDRSKVLDLLDIYLSPSINLITLQLGENVSAGDVAYESDLEKLIDYIRSKAPKAQIALIDDFWSDERSNIRYRVAKNKGLLFADISFIRGKKEYQSKAGTVCYMADGTTELVTKEAETHPGDEGFKYIADEVLKLIGTE